MTRLLPEWCSPPFFCYSYDDRTANTEHKPYYTFPALSPTHYPASLTNLLQPRPQRQILHTLHLPLPIHLKHKLIQSMGPIRNARKTNPTSTIRRKHGPRPIRQIQILKHSLV